MDKELEIVGKMIVSGQAVAARRAIRSLVEKKVPREKKLELASLARRANLHGIALRLLNPLVRPTGKTLERATDAEKAEYAASLTYIGATAEALSLLKEVDESRVPEALLYQAFAHFSQWDYEAATPLLRRYLKGEGLTDYQRLVGKVNLVAALVEERRHPDVQSLVEDIGEETARKGYWLLHGNVLELSAQDLIFQGELLKAEKVIAKGLSVLGKTDSLDYFFLQKWQAILHRLQSPKDSAAEGRLRTVRAEAIRRGHWESARDCDRFHAIVSRDVDWVRYLYFGTPYAAFRRNLLKEFGENIEMPDEYLWCLKGDLRKAPIFDLWEGKLKARRESLKIGMLLHRFLVVLCNDFYQPVRVAIAHHQLHPDEFYNPVTAPPRVYEAVRRLRAWFEKQRLPLDITEKAGFYRLVARAAFSIQLRERETLGKRTESQLVKVREAFGDKPFSKKQVSLALGTSLRSALRLVDRAFQEGIVNRVGNGSAIRYIFRKA